MQELPVWWRPQKYTETRKSQGDPGHDRGLS